MNKIQTINEIIHDRKSVFPINYIKKEITREIIEQILKNADRAPTHKFTEPWRFKVFKGSKKEELGIFLASKYQQITPPNGFLQQKFDKFKSNAILADTIVSIGMRRDPSSQIPEWEEVAAVAMAVQNMYLTCTAYKIGAFWSSPIVIKYMQEFCPMELGEKCLGFFYMGYYDKELPTTKRSPIEEKVDWL